MKIRFILITSLVFLLTLFTGCQSTKDVEVNILATSDIHSIVPDNLVSYVNGERKKDKDLLMVDAGDFFDIQSTEMREWFFGLKQMGVKDGMPEYENTGKERDGETPLAKEMAKLKYDAVVFGNHEFVSNDKKSLDKLVSDFKNNNIPLVSANIYEKSGKNYVKPYVIKNIKTEEGDVKVGVLGLTIKEVGERSDFKDFEKDKKARELGEQAQYKGKLYANDLVEDAKKWVKVMEKEKPDIIVAVVHSGEEPKKPKNPGNRIKELATTVEGIDAIVAGHTHEKIEQHNYKNKSGEEVIVTQPGAHAESVSKINFKLHRKNEKWEIKEKSSKLKNFGKEVNILATSDLHSNISDELQFNLIKEYNNEIQPLLVDAGDFLDPQTEEMIKWYEEWQYIRDTGMHKKMRECPMVMKMASLRYDAVVLGNHEFVAEKDEFWENKFFLDSVISNFNKKQVPVVSANIYKQSGENYVEPYIMKDVDTNEGKVKVGILGLTIKEVGKGLKNVDLQEQPQYKGELYANDLVEDAKKWVKVMEKEKPDIIVAVVHSGEEPKNPKHPGNRIKELATTVEGIDAIVAGHTHEKIDEHDYKNKSGDNVIVTQPGEHGEYFSKISFELEKEGGKWIIKDKSSKAIKVV